MGSGDVRLADFAAAATQLDRQRDRLLGLVERQVTAGGLWIATGDTGLHVYNGRNGLGSVPTVPGHEGVDRMTPLATFVGEA